MDTKLIKLKTLYLELKKKKPNFIISNTIKGKGVSFMENKPKWHGSVAITFEQIKKALSELNNYNTLKNTYETRKINDLSKQNSTLRDQFGLSITKLAKKNKKIVVLDADVAGGTGLHHFRKTFPERFFQCGIAEQNMISMAGGLATLVLYQ